MQRHTNKSSDGCIPNFTYKTNNRRTLNALMRYGSVLQATSAAALYSWIVRAPAAPVRALNPDATLHTPLAAGGMSVYTDACVCLPQQQRRRP